MPSPADATIPKPVAGYPGTRSPPKVSPRASPRGHRAAPPPAGAKTLVVKIGTSTVMADDPLRVNLRNLGTLVEVVGKLRRSGHRIILVASGAVGMGCLKLGVKRPKDLGQKQAVAAAGQARLMRLLDDMFALSNINVGQLLITRGDFADKNRFANVRQTLISLLDMDVIPVINENDSVAVEELRIGDNDSLSAMTAVNVGADWLFLMTDVDYVYENNPKIDPTCEPIRVVDQACGFQTLGASQGGQWGTGGMATKFVAASTAACAGIHCGLLHGEHPERIHSFLGADTEANLPFGTWFVAYPVTATMRDQRRWILSLPLQGHLVLDAGARVAVLEQRKSLLAAGISRVEGKFSAGACVALKAPQGEGSDLLEEVGRALVNFSHDQIILLKGKQTKEFEELLGYVPDTFEVATRDNVIPALR